jgi:hypothetical protein
MPGRSVVGERLNADQVRPQPVLGRAGPDLAAEPERHVDGDAHGSLGAAGTKVSGVIPVETFNFNSFTTGLGDWSSDVLKVAHYSYTIGS